MSPRATLDRPSAQPTSPARSGTARRAVLVVAAVAAVFVLVGLVPTETFVPRITYENRSPYDLHVEVATSRHGGWMDAGEAFRATRTNAQEIYDLGDTWWFRYSAQGHTSRAYEISRVRLVRSRWTVPVPASVARGLRTAGVPVQP